MVYKRKNEIQDDHMVIIQKIGDEVKKLRKETGLSVERFCVKHDIPRITYGNLENGKGSFQITTLLTVLDTHKMDLQKFIQNL